MKVKRDYGNGIVVEVDAVSVVDAFDQLSHCDEVFADIQCVAKVDDKILKSDDVRFNVRMTKDGDKYYELVCRDHSPESHKLCWYKKKFGQYKDEKNLFAKNDVSDNEVAGLNGWSKYIRPDDGYQSGRREDPEPRRESRREESRSKRDEYEEIPF